MDRFPYGLLVNVTIAELQRLRDKAEEATRKFGTKHRVVERNEAIFFCFEKPGVDAARSVVLAAHTRVWSRSYFGCRNSYFGNSSSKTEQRVVNLGDKNANAAR